MSARSLSGPGTAASPTDSRASTDGSRVAPDPARYSRRRTAALLGVHLLIGVHIAHWWIQGRTLAPLELNEVMYTLELGIVTAGFILMGIAALSVAVFGRFFCSWMCHVLALQDLSAWALAKVGIVAKPIRSRLLRVTPFVALFYMFVWPQLGRLWRGESLPRLHVASTADPWASFVTDDFWRNLPGPWIAGLTFLICGFVIVYLLGSRAFCANACPYGALFSLLDRVAPGRIALKGTCTACAKCTAVCQSGVWVHEEIQHYGKVIDPNCLKDLDCLAVCPEQALGFGMRAPAVFRARSEPGRRRRGYHLAWGEDILAAVVLVLALLIFRGLYSAVPFLMALGVGCVLAWLAVLNLRFFRSEHMVLRGLTLRRSGRVTHGGRGFAVASVLLLGFVLHSAFVRWHEHVGDRRFEAARDAVARRDVDAIRRTVPGAIDALETCAAWGIWNPIKLDRQLASIHSVGPTPLRAEPYFSRVLAQEPDDHSARVRRSLLRIRAGRYEEAEADLRQVDRALDAGGVLDPRGEILDGAIDAHRKLAGAREQQGRVADAAAHLERATVLDQARRR